MNNVTIQSKLTVLHFSVCHALFCLDLKFLQKTLGLPVLEIIPGSRNYVVGLLNLGGKSIVVLDLATLLGIERVENYTLNTSILLCEFSGHRIGLVVDDVIGLDEIDLNALQMRNDLKGNKNILGAVNKGNKLSLLLNPQAIMNVNISERVSV